MMQFRDHANNTNDIFLVAAQAIAHTLVKAAAALPAGAETCASSVYNLNA